MVTTLNQASDLTEKQAALQVVLEAIRGGMEVPMPVFLMRLADCSIATAEYNLEIGKRLLELQAANTENLAKMRKLVEAL